MTPHISSRSESPVGAGPARDGVPGRDSRRGQNPLPQGHWFVRRLIATSLLCASLSFTSALAQDDLDGFELPGAARSCFGMLGITEERALAICDRESLMKSADILVKSASGALRTGITSY